jgi:hypothetical protein
MPVTPQATHCGTARCDLPAAREETSLVRTRLAKEYALLLLMMIFYCSSFDSAAWKHPDCCFHATIHSLTALKIYDGITMQQGRRPPG